MYTIKDFKIGDSVYVEVIGNAARGLPDDIETHIKPAVVTKIGKKYVSVKIGDRTIIQFKETCGNYGGGLVHHAKGCSDYILFKTKQDVYDRNEAKSILNELYNVFGRFCGYTIPIDKLREIQVIIKPYIH